MLGRRTLVATAVIGATLYGLLKAYEFIFGPFDPRASLAARDMQSTLARVVAPSTETHLPMTDIAPFQWRYTCLLQPYEFKVRDSSPGAQEANAALRRAGVDIAGGDDPIYHMVFTHTDGQPEVLKLYSSDSIRMPYFESAPAELRRQFPPVDCAPRATAIIVPYAERFNGYRSFYLAQRPDAVK